jgi:Rod binding domain-containing protein
MDSLGNNLQLNTLQWQGEAQAAKLQQLQKEYMNPSSTDGKKLKKAAQEFESVFLNQMLEEMDKTVDRNENGILGGGSSEQYFRSMLNQEIARSMSTKMGGSGLGLAETIYKQMAEHLKPKDQNGGANTPVQGQSGQTKSGEVKP